MEFSFSSSSSVKILLTLILFLVLVHNSFVKAIPEPELDSMLSALRANGYNLFGNAITTSDIRYEILAGNSFTLFAPTDSALFALDMVATASDYVSTLRYHVILSRFSASDLRLLSSSGSSHVHTLVPKQDLLISSVKRFSSPDLDDDDDDASSTVVTVQDVEVILPGLFYGRHIAVHGLNGILNHRRIKSPAQARAPSLLPFLISPVNAPPTESPANAPSAESPANACPTESCSPPSTSPSPSPLVPAPTMEAPSSSPSSSSQSPPSPYGLDDTDEYSEKMPSSELRRDGVPSLAPLFSWPLDWSYNQSWAHIFAAPPLLAI